MWKLISDSFYSLIGLFLSFIVRRDESIWVFGARDGSSYCDNTRFFFEWIRINQSKNIKCYWITKNSSLVNVNNGVIHHNSLFSQYIIASSSLVFVSHSAADVSRFIGWIKPFVYLWHGIPIKKMDNVKSYSKKSKIKNFILPKINTLLFLVTSKRDLLIFSNAYDIPASRFYVGQYPRNINLIEQHSIKNDSKEIKKILFAPTFRDNNDASYFDNEVMPSSNVLKRLEDFLENNNAELYFKLHPYTATAFDFNSLPNNIKHIDKSIDIMDVLCKVDVLVTDYSSVAFDYCLLDKSIVYFLPDNDWYLNDSNRGLYDDFISTRAGEVAYNWDELIILLKKELDNPERTKNLRDDVVDCYFNNRDDNNLNLYQECMFRQKAYYQER
ncbi:CDP-glycerol glycerophosphotransferase family protein [Vibrio cholerae]|uniref:CDP-glycerol glycerophosphotransferase family protein n=1 Tax=Vibrio cholerae TaxID=666 RepID=UPI001FA6AED0|nr:CDP-glycerol glycerophosphotransferase family protein [Vibrio cholerae]MCI4614854.1 CDP-glycerol glycerophosphotransferase family protein [Vibrio cholerae]